MSFWHEIICQKLTWQKARTREQKEGRKDTEHTLSRHFWIWGVNVYCCCLVTQLCPTLWNPMDCSLLGSSVHEIFQARILEWVVISFPGDLPNLGTEPWSSQHLWISGRFFYHWVTGEAQVVASFTEWRDKKPNWISLTIYKN